MPSGRVLTLTLVTAALAACTFDARVGEGTVVTCETGQCPQGLRCHSGTLRCVPEEGFDDTPPALEPGSQLLTLLPPPQSRLATVTALADGARARIRFAVTEPLAQVPELASNPPLSCVLASRAGLAWEYTCELPAGAPPTTAQARLTTVLIDLAGNSAEVELDALALKVDNEAPAPPDTETAGRIRLVRDPWGSDASQGAIQMTVLGAAGAAEPGALVSIQLLGLAFAPVAADGSFGPVVIPALSVTSLNLLVIDGAGNVSAPRRIRDLSVIATHSGKVVGRTRENPHQVFAYPVHGPMQARTDVEEVGDSAGVGLTGGGRLIATGGASWRHLAPDIPTGFLTAPAVAYDAARARVVRFGGENNPEVPSQTDGITWEWAGESWLAISPTDPEVDGDPPSRKHSAMAWHGERRVTVLFGGERENAPFLEDTWTWNGKSWKLILPTGPAPSARQYHAMAYDPRRGKVVLFGGLGASGSLGDTWEWDGQQWVEVVTPGPPARFQHAMAFDPVTGRIVVMGGQAAASSPLSDSWDFDGTTWRPRAINPDVRSVDGGAPTDGGRPLGPLVAAYDLERDRLVVIATSLTRDTWEVAGDGWVKGGPFPSNSNPALVYSGAARRVLHPGQFVAACIFVCFRVIVPTATWDGSTWTQLKSVPDQLGPTAVLAFSERLGAVVAYDESGLLQFRQGIWTLAPNASGSSPSNFVGYAALAPLQSGGVLLHGTLAPLATWVHDGAGWAQLSANVGPSNEPVLVPVGGSIVSVAVNGEQYEFKEDAGWSGPWATRARVSSATGLSDGGAYLGLTNLGGGFPVWTPGAGISLVDAGAIPTGASVVFDSQRERILSVGGALAGTSPLLAELFESTDGLNWNRARVCDAEGDSQPLSRNKASVAFDKAAGRVMLTGGEGSFPVDEGVWALEAPGTRPSVVFHVSVPDLDIPSGAELVGLSVRALAGGKGRSGASTVDGVKLALFKNGSWWEPGGTATNATAGAAQLGPVSWSTTATRTLEALLVHQPQLSVAVLPVGVSDASPAQAVLDSIEVTVDYRLP